MQKIHLIDPDYINTRIDKWIKNNICKVPQGLIEKNLRHGNILVNNIKVKSSYKLRANDKIILKNFVFLGLCRQLQMPKNKYFFH